MNPLIADIVINSFAILGIGLYGISVLQRKRLDGLERRLLWLLGGIMAVMFARVFFWATGDTFFDRLLIFAAFALPFLLLLTAEGVMRRHAALPMKLLTTVGMFMGLGLSFMHYRAFGLWLSLLLAGVQIATCVFCLVWVFRRKRADLSPPEQHFAGVFCVALAFVLPLIVTDFTEITGLPVRLGGLGLLLGIFVMMRTTVDNVLLRQALGEVAVMAFFSALFLGLSVLALHLKDWDALLLLGSALFAMFVATGITVRVLGGYLSVSRLLELETLARADMSDPEKFLKDALNSPYAANASVLRGKVLDSYEIRELQRAFAENPVISHRHLRDKNDKAFSVDVREQLTDIFSHGEATHACFVSGTTPALLLFCMPPLGNERDFSAHVALIQKIANALARGTP